MLHIEEGQLHSLTMENIDILIQKLNNEKVRRQSAEKNEAIENFHKAFNRLRGLGIVPYYCEKYEEFEDDPRYLKDWDEFGFNS